MAVRLANPSAQPLRPHPAKGAVGQDFNVTHLSGRAATAVVETIIQDDTPANAGSDENRHQVPGASSGTQDMLAYRTSVDVVVQGHRQPQVSAEHASQGLVLPFQVWGIEHQTLLGIHGSRSTNPDSPDPFRIFSQVFQELTDRCSDSPGDSLGTQAGTSGTFPGGKNSAPAIQSHRRHAGASKVNPHHEVIFLSHLRFSPEPQAAA